MDGSNRRQVAGALSVRAAVALALLVVAAGAWSCSSGTDFHSCDNPAGARLNATLPLYPGATLVAKEACGGVGTGRSTLYFASADDAQTIMGWFETAWADWAEASGGEWVADGLRVHTGLQPGGGGGVMITLELPGSLPKPAKDVERLTVAKAPNGTQTYFLIEQQSSMW